MRKQRTVKSRNMTEIYDYMTAKSYQGGGKKPRAPRVKPTVEEVKRNNLRMAKAKLRMIIDNNFVPDDYYCTLTFDSKTYGEKVEVEIAKKCIAKFVRDLRKAFKKQTDIPLKYIYIPEEKGRIHFHILFNRGIEVNSRLMKKLWPHGFVDIGIYHGEAEDAIALAEYHTKEQTLEKECDRAFKRTWVKSNTVEYPEETVKTVKATEWRKEVKVPRGYYLDKDSYYEGVNNAGYPFRFYRLIKLNQEVVARRI